MLGETFEADYPDKGIRFFSEKVSIYRTKNHCYSTQIVQTSSVWLDGAILSHLNGGLNLPITVSASRKCEYEN